jgi:hypothetical protein
VQLSRLGEADGLIARGLEEIAYQSGQPRLAGALFATREVLDTRLPEPSARARFGEVNGFVRTQAAAQPYQHAPTSPPAASSAPNFRSKKLPPPR